MTNRIGQMLTLNTTEAAATGRGRRRCVGSSHAEHRADWAPKWRHLLSAEGGAPEDFTEFDRTVRGVLNRISSANASRILPLEPALRGAEFATGDCPAWWAARFAALMLSSYVQAIRTSRHARGLATRSADNVLPGYLDAVAPLLVNSPRLVTAIMAGLARMLRWHDLCWPTIRLLLLAACERRDRDSLPRHALGLLPADLIRGRILGFLVPPSAVAVEGLLDASLISFRGDGEEAERDVVSVLAHLIMFAPLDIWPRLAAFSFSLVELALVDTERCQEREVYLAASILYTLAERIERVDVGGADARGALARRLEEDRALARRFGGRLREATAGPTRRPELSAFAACRAQAALEHALLGP